MMDLQKASMWKRISAYLFDTILLATLAVALSMVLSMALGYDDYNATLEAAYDKYETQFGIEFEMTAEEFEAMTPEQEALYDQAYDALCKDEQAMHAYNMVLNLSLIITTASLLIAYLLLEFAVPLLLKNGQTLGKKIFGVALIREDGVQLNTVQLFTRTVLGKFVVETMIPVYVLIMLFFNTADMLSLLLLAGIAIGQVICVLATRTNSAIHDKMAGTVAVDLSSQRIFSTTEDLIAYKKSVHAEEAAKKSY